MPIGELAAVVAALTWAIGSILFANIGKTVPPGAMNLGKLLVAGSLLTLTHAILSMVHGQPVFPIGLPTRALLLLSASGVVGLTIGDTAYFAAMEELGVSRAILLLSTAPVFAALGGYLWMGESLDRRAMLGMMLTVAGVSLVIARGTEARTQQTIERRASPRGIVLGLISALGQAGGSLLSRRAMQSGIDPLAASAGRIVVGGVGVVLVALVTRRGVVWLRALAKDRAWTKVTIGALLGTYAGIWLAQIALSRASSTGAAATLLATPPVFALPLAHFLKLDRVTKLGVVGASIALVGVAVLSSR